MVFITYDDLDIINLANDFFIRKREMDVQKGLTFRISVYQKEGPFDGNKNWVLFSSPHSDNVDRVLEEITNVISCGAKVINMRDIVDSLVHSKELQ